MSRRPLHLFEGYGMELEYVLVNSGSLDIVPVSDRLLRSRSGRFVNEVKNGDAGWSNEFVLHVLEVKNNRPLSSLPPIGAMLQEQVKQINRLLEGFEARLMPTAMHPWMDPARETRFWNHGNRRIYETYDRIFGCRTHGWANIQSCHLNLPFHGDGEFGRLHAAVRLILPLIPALAASSPVVEGRITGIMDNRLAFYRTNQLLVSSVSGSVIPESVLSRSAYEREILERMYSEIAPFDREGILRHEWLNSRGAIPRFERSAIEVRLTDSQECPLADTAIAAALSSVLESLVQEQWSGLDEQAAWPVEPLVTILDSTISSAGEAVIRDTRYLRAFGYPGVSASAGDLWRHLIEESLIPGGLCDEELLKPLTHILDQGTLSRRIVRALGENYTRERLREVYGMLCDCLSEGRLFAA